MWCYGRAVRDPSLLRADARRNRDLIVTAARRAFAEQGLRASLDEIAKDAGIGSGTLYRHFPSRDQLVAAVFTGPLSENVAAVENALAAALGDHDPWGAFAGYVQGTCRAQASDKGLAELLAVGHDDQQLSALRARAYQGFVALIDAAKAAGNLRSDFAPEDMYILLMANAGITDRAGAAAGPISDRFVALTLDGYCTQNATNSPPAPTSQTLLNLARQAHHRDNHHRTGNP